MAGRQRGADGGPRPDFDRIEARDLRGDRRLRDLYAEAVRRGFWPNSNAAALEFAALAEKALRDDRHGTPGRLFYALIKRKDGSMVTDGAERRAMERFPSHVRQDMVDDAAGRTARTAPRADADAVADVLADRKVGYSHAVMMQCFLPQKSVRARRHETSHGRASLVVEAGSLPDPDSRHEWRRCAVPSGSKPRLILPYIVGEAVRSGSRDVDLGRSLRDFMARLDVPVGGKNGKALTAQVRNVAAASIVIGEWTDDAVHARSGKIAERVSFWAERDPRQGRSWRPEMKLSSEFFAAIQEHRVPVDVGHLASLAKSPRRMDLYAWLSYRTPRIRKGRRHSIPLRAVWDIFAPEIGRFADFKARLRGDLAAIGGVYPGFNVDVDGDILWLRRSPPPVPFAARLTLPADWTGDPSRSPRDGARFEVAPDRETGA